MRLTTPSVIRELLAAHGMHTDKRHGQHFLADENILQAIANAAEFLPGEGALEIGAGIGTLTTALAQRAARVLSFEIDNKILPLTREILADYPNVQLVERDFLRSDPADLAKQCFGTDGYCVVANIPYNITAPILEVLFTELTGWRRAVLLIQKEVADRLLAKPGEKGCSSVSVFAHYHCTVRLLRNVPASVFYPPPKVQSAVVQFDPVPPILSTTDEHLLFQITRAAFGQRRKTLGNSLAGVLDISKDAVADSLREVGIDPQRRGETLSLEEFISIVRLWGSEGEG
ncbi:MAG: 16S rRNA (adenine(1518)-N(6)/adenine(1519)-N(6))-dimethyltransferase RsmA [Armatimonadota bacterium]